MRKQFPVLASQRVGELRSLLGDNAATPPIFAISTADRLCSVMSLPHLPEPSLAPPSHNHDGEFGKQDSVVFWNYVLGNRIPVDSPKALHPSPQSYKRCPMFGKFSVAKAPLVKGMIQMSDSSREMMIRDFLDVNPWALRIHKIWVLVCLGSVSKTRRNRASRYVLFLFGMIFQEERPLDLNKNYDSRNAPLREYLVFCHEFIGPKKRERSNGYSKDASLRRRHAFVEKAIGSKVDNDFRG
ncbi:hypothetical protein JCGZ_03714 [Jatropha curcas]|uniref:Uncharacterized protein n=1 Tax=Jatropha curcas TaxID=180498 RepID=A0A067KTE9_JATCU|nr:hypothetical protein JCGZ_03714 [Jatropha curcas]